MSSFSRAVDCCKAAGDIPRVEAAIRVLQPLLLARLERLAVDVLERLLRRLDSFETLPGAASVRALVDSGPAREETLRAIVASLILLVERGFAAPFDASTERFVEDAVTELLDAGAAFYGVPAGGATEVLRQTAEAELALLVQEAVLGHRAQLAEAFEQFLTTASARTTGTALQEAAGDSLAGRGSWESAVVAIVAPSAAWAAAVDTWAYSWHNVGGFRAARAAGARAFQVVSRLDGRETAFCRWVHGRIVSTARVEDQIRRRTEAALRGDRAGVIAAQPFLDSEVAKHGNAYQFERFFRRAGLAPYHHGCRTQARPIFL